MLENRNDKQGLAYEAEPVMIGLFSYASDARRALRTLQEHHFTSGQLIAAFRDPASARPSEEGSISSGRESSRWFGQLRQIYQGNEQAGSMSRANPAAPLPGSGTASFDAMLAEIDLSEEDEMMFNRDLDRGAAIVAVRAGTRNHEASALLEKAGARIVHSRRPRPAEATDPGSAVQINSTPFHSPEAAKPDHIQLFGEVLRVRKEKVSSGDVHVRKEAVTHMETVQVPVTREHLVVEHTDGSGSVDEEHTFRVPLSEERVHIDKDTVLREEYKVGKREVTQNESVSDSVRRERLLIDDASADAKS